jgi:hypothetical protein
MSHCSIQKRHKLCRNKLHKLCHISYVMSPFRSIETSYGFDIPKFRSQKIPESTPEVSVGQKRATLVQKHEISVLRNKKSEVSVREPEVSIGKPEVSV